ncbi:MAG: RagB/SusD family nutrient uptake outer membrane protein [Candidatus Pseudobacter hemicellulosilyticus]|uniref:RagB/SusD family nutrient uptake outer membrane protein n=1 Tax=Candidatus Pseudobacter hemicellulosilyticus TaxID=3121375 RepID=A0AAJ5WX82_9BACT|nr:MAG: RagB/SusD family nutrient uptake outer membrane protein [Pseudobacter sp.]
MKKNSLLFLTVITGILMTACNKDFLERYPTSAVSPPTFFQSENDFISYTNNFYTDLQGGTDVYGESADNIVKSSVTSEVAGNRLVPATGGGWDWDALRTINFLLTADNVINYPDAVVRDKYIGLARFFRAWFYFRKVQRFGDVPWYNKVIATTDQEALYKKRDPRVLIMDSVLNDINFAIAHLDSSSKSLERVTKWTALALKSRICLYEGSWRKYHTEFSMPDADRYLNESVSASQHLMNSNMYSIFRGTNGPSGKPYQDLFASMTLETGAAEIILGRRYSAELNLKHDVQFYLVARTQGKPGMEKKLVNSYLMSDGSRFTDKAGYQTMQFYEEVQGRDPRLAQTIRTPGYTRIGGTQALAPDFESTMTGYQPVKWMNNTSMDVSGQSVQDLTLFRYAEVLLNYAEAKAELGTLDQTDLNNSIKLIRDRVGMPNIDMAAANASPDPYLAQQYVNVSGANKGVILEIRRERRIELVMENGFRWEDLMRWKEGQLLALPFQGMYFPGAGFYDLDQNGSRDVEIYSGSQPPATGPYQIAVSELSEGTSGYILTNRNIIKKFDETKDYLYPLPIDQLTLNPALEQNPNWK